jgi:hypothetical protein
MKQKNFLRILMIICFGLISKNINSQSAGDIAFIAFNADGDDEFAIVALANIPANTSIWFTDNEWDGDSFNNINEGEVEWSHTSILPAGSIVVIQGNSGTLVSDLGTISGSGINLGASNETLYALLSQPLASTMVSPGFLAGISNDDSGSGGTLTGTGLTSGTNFIDFDDDADGYKYAESRTNQALFSDYLPLIMNTANWQTETSDGTLILPISTTSFTVGAATPGITLGTVSNNTNETGTTATFTIVLDAQPTTNVVLNISSGDTGEVTLDLATVTFTNADWDTPQTVTATGVDDALSDGSIVVTITVAVDDASSDDDYDAAVDINTTVTNEDDELPDLVINEFQADPDATLGDANGDGSVDTGDDEFIEIYNASGAELNITNYTIEENSGLKHTFPDGTILPAGAVIVVFAGGTPTGIPCLTQIASTGSLSLNNGGDSITIKDASSTVVTTYTYGSEGGDNQSMTRDIDLTGAFVKHSTIAGNAVLFSPGRKNADNIPFSKTWTGTTNNDWATTTNWDSNSNPSTSTDNVWIPIGLTNYPTSAAAVTVNSVTINSGATLKATNTFTANVTYNRTLTNGSQWYYMSSPVVGATYNDAWATANSVTSGQNNNKGLSWYDNTSYDTNTGAGDTETGYWRYLQSDDSNTGPFNVGQGYGIITSSSTTVSFIGTGINTSSKTRAITTDVSNFNMVGNPFTSYLNLGEFYADNPKTTVLAETEAYFWNGSSYDTKTSGLHSTYEIAPGQGFFIEAVEDTNLTFDISDTNHLADTAEGADTFQKSSRPEIHLFLSDGTSRRYSNFYYIDGTTTGFDSGYDGKLFGGVTQSFALYSHLVSDSEGKHFQLQSLPKDNYENMVIPVGISADAGKEITFTADVLNLPSGLKVLLEDRQTNTFTRLDETNSEYKVRLTEASNGVGRFYMHTTESAMSTESVILNSVSIFKTNSSTLKITGLPQGKTSFYLYNILGKEMMTNIFTSNGNKEISLSKLASGIYLAKIKTKKGAISKKIILE